MAGPTFAASIQDHATDTGHRLHPHARRRDLRHHRAGTLATDQGTGDDRQRELREQPSIGSHGFGADEQIRGRPSRQALLRRLRIRGHGGEPGHRAGEEALRRGLGERAAPQRRAGQRGGDAGLPAAGRYHPRFRPQPWRPPHPRLTGELQRQAVPGHLLWREQRDRPGGHGYSGRDRPQGEAQADHLRGQRLQP